MCKIRLDFLSREKTVRKTEILTWRCGYYWTKSPLNRWHSFGDVDRNATICSLKICARILKMFLYEIINYQNDKSVKFSV